MKKSILFTIFGIGLLMAEGDIVVDTSIYDEYGFKKTQIERYNPPSQKITHDMNIVYIDRKTKLMWQDEKYTDEEEGSYFHQVSLGKVGNWSHANMYCVNLSHAGYIDWRLPTLDEVMALHRYHDSGLKYSQALDFWTSTPHRGDNYWSVFTADGYPHSHNRDDIQHFRCVRDYHKNTDRHSAVGRI